MSVFIQPAKRVIVRKLARECLAKVSLDKSSLFIGQQYLQQEDEAHCSSLLISEGDKKLAVSR